MDAESLQGVLDRREHLRHRIAVGRRELLDVRALVSVLGDRLPTPERRDRLAKAVHLRAGVVVVVLARHVVAAERQQACNTVAVRTVSGRGDDDRAGRIRRDHLHLDPLGRVGPAASVPLPDLRQRREEERVGDAHVDEPRPRHLCGRDLVEGRDLLGVLLCELARRPADGLGRAQRDVRREIAVSRILGAFELDSFAQLLSDASGEPLDGARQGLPVARTSRPTIATGRNTHAALVSSRQMDDGPERQLNIHMDPANLAGVYANFANITFSDYEFTLTFARIDHEVEEGDVPGVVVSRVNMSQQFMRELLAAMQDAYSKYATVKGIQDLPETDDHP